MTKTTNSWPVDLSPSWPVELSDLGEADIAKISIGWDCVLTVWEDEGIFHISASDCSRNHLALLAMTHTAEDAMALIPTVVATVNRTLPTYIINPESN
jgi:hypothetical protein